MTVVLALTLVALGAETVPIPVVLSTDFGAERDDLWALTHLAYSKKVELRAVITSHAPGIDPVSEARGVSGYVEALPITGKPAVVVGSLEPLIDRRKPRRNAGVELLLKESRRASASKRLTVVMTGAATDVASALLIDPTVSERIEVVAMAFSRWPEGGDPWNVKNDVRAWQVLLDSDTPLVVGDDAVCTRHLTMSGLGAWQMFAPTGVVGTALATSLEGWIKGHRALAEATTGDRNTLPIWDEVTVASLLGLAETEDVPRPTLRDDTKLEHPATKRTIRWVRALKEKELWGDLKMCLLQDR